MARVVREVGVHLEDKGVGRRERPAEAGEVGAPQPFLLLAVQDMDARLLRRERVGQLRPVPSGELSSTTRISSRWLAARMAVVIGPRLSASL